MKIIEHNAPLTGIIHAYLSKVDGISKMAGGKITVIQHLKLERDLAAEVISNQYGGMAIGIMLGSLIALYDSIAGISTVDEEEGRGLVGIGQTIVEDAAVQVILRAEPKLDTVTVRREVNARLLRLQEG
jgi:hypothetical protein